MWRIRMFFIRLSSLFKRRQLDADLDEEIRTHLALLATEYERRGMAPAEARAAARRAFGGVEQMKAAHRHRRGLPWVEILQQDVTYAARQLRRAPGYALAGMLTLALCIGANVTVFTIVDDVLFRPLAYPDSDRLVTVFARLDPFGRIPVSDSQLRAWRPALKSFDGMALIFGYDVNLSGRGEPERVAAARVSPELFSLLGVQPQLGRLLRPDEDVPGRDRVVVLSNSLWRRRFAADPAIVGRTVTIDGEPFEVVGVLPDTFRFPAVSRLYSIPLDAARPELWKPFAIAENDPFSGTNFAGIGRLARGVTIEQARQEIDALQRAILESRGPSNATLPADLVPLREHITSGSRRGLEVLLAAVGVVLLIACVNVTNLILVRSSARRRELAMRAALGATRRRLAGQLFTEGVVLACVGGLIGMVIATLAVRVFVLAAPIDLPRLDEVDVDARIFLFAIAIVGAAAAVVGLLPAVRVFRASTEHMGTGGATFAPMSEQRSRLLQSTLVVVQVSLTIVCAVTAGLLLQSLMRLLNVDKGFDATNVVTATLDLAGPQYTGRRTMLQGDLIDRLQRLPGVSAVAISNQQLLAGTGMNLRIVAEGSAVPILERPLANFRSVNGDYFRALGIVFQAGRTFAETDKRAVAVVSRATAERLWPGQDAVGKRFRRGPDSLPPVEVVGVVADVRTSRLEQPPGLTIYLPYWQSPSADLALAVKTSFDARAIAPEVRAAVRSIDPELPLSNLGTLSTVVTNSVGERRFLAWLVTSFAIGALMLAVIGIYGVLSQSVTQRTAEMGLRLALGARHHAVVGMILREAWQIVGVGLFIGIPITLASGSLLRSMLFEIVPNDPLTVAGSALVLTIAATLAAYVPARRASRIDPVIALRGE
jgi:putative ABC transport system permease protein